MVHKGTGLSGVPMPDEANPIQPPAQPLRAGPEIEALAGSGLGGLFLPLGADS
jgi:hypothetical protein